MTSSASTRARCSHIGLKRVELAALALLVTAAGCGGSEEPVDSAAGCADVVAVEMTALDSSYQVSATVSSPDTGWDKYADAWVVRSLDGEVFGTRELTHPHVAEQPFTRSLGGLELPEGVETVEVAARDSVEGFCGETVAIPVP